MTQNQQAHGQKMEIQSEQHEMKKKQIKEKAEAKPKPTQGGK